MKSFLFGLVLIIIAQACTQNVAPGNTAASVAYKQAPNCIKEKIKVMAKEPMQNPPVKIFRYKYRGKTVYYETAVCCDNYSTLYDSSCKILGNPDGGITGRGDGKFPNFSNEATEETLVWEDGRNK